MTLTDNNDIILGLSDKKDGPMKFSVGNRFLFFQNKGLTDKKIVSAGLVHQNRVVKVDDVSESMIIPDCDALITDNPHLLLTVTVADCLPIYFYDDSKKVVAIAHAGWRGVVLEIAKEVVRAFVDNYRSTLSDIKVFVGPHLRDCHFEVKDDVASYFPAETIVRDDKIYVDIGVLADNIKISLDCTYCLENRYFSFRRDNPQDLETMIAYIALK